MNLEEILQDIHGLDTKLAVLEQQYGLLSEDMYQLYQLGEWEQSRDLIRWIGYYELRQERQKAYPVALRERLLILLPLHNMLPDFATYCQLLANLPVQFPQIKASALQAYTIGKQIAEVEGVVSFTNGYT